MKRDTFASAIAVNLTAPERITGELLEQKLVNANGQIVGVASTPASPATSVRPRRRLQGRRDRPGRQLATSSRTASRSTRSLPASSSTR